MFSAFVSPYGVNKTLKFVYICKHRSNSMGPSLDLPQVELMNFRVEYVRPRIKQPLFMLRSGRASEGC